MKFDKMIDLLDPKSDEPKSMTLDKFMSLLNPSEKKELENAKKESRKKNDPKNRDQKK